MRKEVRKELGKVFAANMRQRFPLFKPETKSLVNRDWLLQLEPSLYCLIKLVPLEQKDIFDIDIGWTDGDLIGIGENYQEQVDLAAVRWGTRLSDLVAMDTGVPRRSTYDGLWQIAPVPSEHEQEVWGEAFMRREVKWASPPDPPVNEILPRVEPLVHDAFDKLERHAIPLFKRLAESRSVPWPKSA